MIAFGNALDGDCYNNFIFLIFLDEQNPRKLQVMVFAEREMTQQGAALQTYNNELVKSLEELKARRAALQQQIEAESLEKRKLESEKARLEERLDLVNSSLEEKMLTGREYDRVTQEAEQAYTKILESSQVLLNVVQTKSQDLRCNPREERRGSGGGGGGGGTKNHFISSTTPDSGFHQAK